MGITSKIAECLLIAALSTVVCAQSSPVKQETPHKREQPFSEAALEKLVVTLSKNRRVGLFSGPSQSCTITKDGDECPATLTPQALFDVNNKLVACAAAIGEIMVDFGTLPKGTTAVIHWTIGPADPQTPANATYAFDEKYGAIILRDGDNATSKKVEPNSTGSDLYVKYKLKRHISLGNPAPQKITYYPLVFQSIVVNDPAPSLCASADPQVANN